jgi:hypothetical protein
VADTQEEADQDTMSPFNLVHLAKARHCPFRDAVLYFVGAEHWFREREPGQVTESAPARPELTKGGIQGSAMSKAWTEPAAMLQALGVSWSRLTRTGHRAL